MKQMLRVPKRNRNIRRAYKEAMRFYRKGLTPVHVDELAGKMMEKTRRTNNRRKIKKYGKRWVLLCLAETLWSAS